MTYNEIKQKAIAGAIIMLPSWEGVFVWDYATNTLVFRNGNYQLTEDQIKERELDQRTDWYYII